MKTPMWGKSAKFELLVSLEISITVSVHFKKKFIIQVQPVHRTFDGFSGTYPHSSK